MKTTLHFTEFIQAPRARVWTTLQDPDSYRLWTAEFCGGSYFEGSWAEGARIRFLIPGGDGMTSVIAENRLHEFISIRHLGDVKQGVDDTDSEAVRAWAPAHENYRFVDQDGGTEVQVSVEITPDFSDYMHRTFPKALQRLKALCEAPA